MTRILLATDDQTLEGRIRAAFSASLNGDLRRCPTTSFASTDAMGALERLVGLPGDPPEVLILGPDLAPEDALALASCFDHERPDVSVLLVAPRSAEVLERALRVGVRDVFGPDADGIELRRAVEHALEVAARRRQHLATRTAPSGPPGKLIVVVSPKGGSGKTTVCANLAVGLAQTEGGNTALVDLDLQFGDVASALRLLPEANWADVSRAGNFDATALKVFLTPHPSGLFALCAPDLPSEGEFVKSDQVNRVLQLLAGEFRNVVVDTAAGIDEHTLAALEVATDVVFLCSMDVPSVRSLRKELVTLDQLGMTYQRRHFVLNRADARVGLEASDVEATVGLSIDVALPSSRAVPLAMNQGTPVIESEPRSPVARQLNTLVDRFAEAERPRPGGLFRRRKDA